MNVRFTPYHRFLLDSQHQRIYNTIGKSLKNGDTHIIVDSVPQSIGCDEVRKILTGFMNDNPSIFWIDRDYEVISSGGKLILDLQTNDFYDDRQNISSSLLNSAEHILSKIETNNDYDTSLKIHDYLTSNIVYGDTGRDDSHSIVGPLMDGKGVCDGISKTYNLLMNMSGVRCTTVNGHTHGETIGHSWNISVLEGHAYHTDVTFDLGGSHRFLNLDDDMMSLTHRFNRFVNCDSTELNYHLKCGSLFPTVSEADSYVISSLNRRKEFIEFMVLEPSDNQHFLDIIRERSSSGNWYSRSSEDGRGFIIEKGSVSSSVRSFGMSVFDSLKKLFG